jgi:hypothetical protein
MLTTLQMNEKYKLFKPGQTIVDLVRLLSTENGIPLS